MEFIRGVSCFRLSIWQGDEKISQRSDMLIVGKLDRLARSVLHLERQRDGISAAKAQGKYRGRVPTAKRKADAVRKLLDDGLNAAEVAKRLYISRASVYRIRAMEN
jgi:DNA invertase Pin-like site-specific DNA recombinase